MPRGEGYFIEIKTGEVIPIYEHLADVQSRPKRYGLTSEEIKPSRPGMPREEVRCEVLRRVFRNGFIRVRTDGDGTVFEFDSAGARAIRVIRRFIRKKGLVGHHRVRINDLGLSRSVEATGREILTPRKPLPWAAIAGPASSPGH